MVSSCELRRINYVAYQIVKHGWINYVTFQIVLRHIEKKISVGMAWIKLVSEKSIFV
jgi:hypothetical protein